MDSVVNICRAVLKRLSEMDYERKGGSSVERLIFPNTSPSIKEGKTFTEVELLKYTRISEQELRFLFVEEFLKEPSNDFYYSVETPTKEKYKFGKTHDDIKIDPSGRSASIDMCIFKKCSENKYHRLLNIEFKNANTSKKSISKDILKLMHEEENGAFVLLLKNTNTGTLNNSAESRFGVIDKLIEAINYHQNKQVLWNGGDKKVIELIILSLEEKEKNKALPFIYHRTIYKSEMDTLDISLNKWKKEVLDEGVYKWVNRI
jgi:hypothetical protein